MKKIIICSRPNACCPTLTVPTTKDSSYADDDKFTLVDDYGGTVTLTWVQLQELRNTINNL